MSTVAIPSLHYVNLNTNRLDATYVRLRDDHGITPHACLEHGMTTSTASTEFVRESAESPPTQSASTSIPPRWRTLGRRVKAGPS